MYTEQVHTAQPIALCISSPQYGSYLPRTARMPLIEEMTSWRKQYSMLVIFLRQKLVILLRARFTSGEDQHTIMHIIETSLISLCHQLIIDQITPQE